MQPDNINLNHILVIDDDERIRDLLSKYLKKNNFIVSVASSTKEAREVISIFKIDIIILDVMLPNEKGTDFAIKFKKEFNTPILMLSALADTEDRITGLETGVDDYLSKPFEPRELLLRLNSILKRTQQNNNENIISFSGYQYDKIKRNVKKNDQNINLTTKEIQLLEILINNLNQVISREDLSIKSDNINERSIDVQITRLRNKLEKDPRYPEILITIRGEGYMLIA